MAETRIRKKGDSYQARVSISGKRISKTFASQSEAARWLQQKDNEKLMGKKLGYDPKATVSDIIDRYLREISPTHKGYAKEKIRLRKIQRYSFSSVKSIYLDSADFSAWRDERLLTVKASTVIREWSLLSAILSQGVEWGMLPENYLLKVRKPKDVKPRDRRVSEDEVSTLVYLSEFKFGVTPEFNRQKTGAAFLFALETACRAGEIARLKWEDVHIEERFIFLKDTKNGESRFVPLSKKALKILDTMRLIRTAHDERVFKIESNIITQSFIKLKEEANLKEANLHFHDTRREAISRMANKIPDPMILAKISGHKDLKVLLNTYYSAKPEDLLKYFDD